MTRLPAPGCAQADPRGPCTPRFLPQPSQPRDLPTLPWKELSNLLRGRWVVVEAGGPTDAKMGRGVSPRCPLVYFSVKMALIIPVNL